MNGMGMKSRFRVLIVLTATVLTISVIFATSPGGRIEAQGVKYQGPGSLPESGKMINQVIYPTFGNPVVRTRGSSFIIEWDWRFGDPSPDAPVPPASGTGDWNVYIKTSVAANVQHYEGSSTDETDLYRNPGKYGYGTYEKPVHTVINTRALKVSKVERGASDRWPVVFEQRGFPVEKITVEVPRNIPLDLYDLHVEYRPNLPEQYTNWAPAGHGDWRTDLQPHALQVIKEYKRNVKILHITDTHMYGQEMENGLGGTLTYKSFELREPRPGTPDRPTPGYPLTPGFDKFPLDKDGDGKTNEGAIYLQEQLQAINLINPDFVVFTGDATFALHDYSTYPNFDDMGGGCATGHVGSEYRFEFPWWYDELLALNVPVYCAAIGNHDGNNWDRRDGMGGPEGVLDHDDGIEIWEDLFGPAYFSWDYGDYHFLGVNTMDWPEIDHDPKPSDNDLAKILRFLFGNAFPETAFDFQDRAGTLITPRKVCPPWNNLPFSIIYPHQDGGMIGEAQLDWIRQDLEGNINKSMRAVFTHKGPFGANWTGAQELVDLMRRNRVAFNAWGDSHDDRIVKGYPWDDGEGEVVGINTTSSGIHVDEKGLAFETPRASYEYAGYRLIPIENGSLVPGAWGFPGVNGDPDNKWSIPGWEGLTVGATADENSYLDYRNTRPSVQWMEQDNGYTDPAKPEDPARNKVKWGDDGTFDKALPLDKTGPYTDVSCKVKNTLNQTGAVLDLTGCRVEFPMKLMFLGRYYYKVDYGIILEQYNTDANQRMVVVSADAGADKTTPVRVSIGGRDYQPPVADRLQVNDGSGRVGNLDVILSLEAHDVGGAGMMDYRVSNKMNMSGAKWMQYDGPVTTPWRLAGSAGNFGPRTVYVQFRDAAMPGNVKTKTATVLYRP